MADVQTVGIGERAATKRNPPTRLPERIPAQAERTQHECGQRPVRLADGKITGEPKIRKRIGKCEPGYQSGGPATLELADKRVGQYRSKPKSDGRHPVVRGKDIRNREQPLVQWKTQTSQGARGRRKTGQNIGGPIQ